MTETNFWKKLKKKLEAAGWLCEKIPQGRFKAGFPDCVLIGEEGEVIFMELKVGSNKVPKLQEKKLRAMDRKGACAIIGRYDGKVSFKTIQEEMKEEESKESTVESCINIEEIWEDK